MPWEVTGAVKERTRFIETYLTGLYTLTELADRFGVSRALHAVGIVAAKPFVELLNS